MTTGAVIFAQGSGKINYIAIAERAARQIHQYLDLPVTLITDQPVNNPVFDQIVTASAQSGGQRHWPGTDFTADWFNIGRSRAFELSPYDTTLLLDADYWVYSDSLKLIVNSPQSFQCHSTYIGLPLKHDRTCYFGKAHVPMWWATVIKFDRNERSQDIFTAWQMIEKNYHHYASLFGFDPNPFRNDYALSLALLLMSGNQQPADVSIPWPLLNIEPGNHIELDQTRLTLTFNRVTTGELKSFKMTLNNMDIHVMDKKFLETQIGS
jgi:hypothetical protein